MSSPPIIISWIIALLLVQTVSAGSSVAPPLERIVWDHVPISVVLRVGSERRVRFSTPVQAEMPSALEATLRTQWVDSHFYWLANAPIEPTRIRLRTDDGRFLLIDLSATSDGPTHPLEVHLPSPAESDAAPAQRASTDRPRRYGNVALTRFAARELYAPERLRHPLPGVTPLSVPRTPLALYRGGTVATTAIASWHAGERMISAIEVCNRTTTTVTLDPRAIRPRGGCGYGTCLLAAAFQHNRLAPRDAERPCTGYDVTALYLITTRPLAESLPPSTEPRREVR